MSAIYFMEGLEPLLQSRNRDALAAEPQYAGLFVAVSGGLSRNTVLSDFTPPSLGSGYTPFTISPGQWVYAIDVINNSVSGTLAASFVFSPGAAFDVLGYYVFNGTGSFACFGEVFAVAIHVPPGGGKISLSIVDTYKMC